MFDKEISSIPFHGGHSLIPTSVASETNTNQMRLQNAEWKFKQLGSMQLSYVQINICHLKTLKEKTPMTDKGDHEIDRVAHQV